MALVVNPSLSPILLLELRLGARVWGFAERPVVAGSGSAATRYTGGLEVALTDEIELSAKGPPVRQVSIRVADDGSWADITTQLEAVRARLYTWGGGEEDEAELVMVGRLSEPALSDPEAPAGLLAFTLAEVEGEDRGILVETCRVEEETFPAEVTSTGITGDQVPPAYAGRYYPEVIGRPGSPFPTWFTSDGVASASPAVWGQHKAGGLYANGTSIIVKAGVSRATTARVWDQDGTSATVDLETTIDLRGQKVTQIDMSSAGSLAAPAAATDVSTGWAVGWTTAPTTGPGGALRGLGDVLVWALERAGVDVPGSDRGLAWDIDWATLLDCRGSLNRFKIDTYIAEQVGVWSWLTSDVLPYFPVFLGRSGRGVTVQEWRYRASADEAAIELEAGRNAHRIAAVSRSELSSVATEITVGLGLDARTGDAIRRAVMTGGGVEDVRLSGAGRHAVLERLWSLVGRRAEDFTVPIVWESATGYEVAEYLAARYAAPIGEVWYRLPWQMAWLRPGLVATLVDDEGGLDEVATITGRRLGPGCVDVRLLPHPR